MSAWEINGSFFLFVWNDERFASGPVFYSPYHVQIRVIDVSWMNENLSLDVISRNVLNNDKSSPNLPISVRDFGAIENPLTYTCMYFYKQLHG
jgi:hypothetical protein